MKQKTAAGIKALLAVRDAKPASQLALDLYQIGGLTGSVETYQRRIRSCFDPERNEYFQWWEVIAMMEVTGCHEPFFYLCNLLGYNTPTKQCPDDQAAYHTNQIAILEAEMEKHRQALASLPPSTPTDIVARFARAKYRE